MTLVGEQKVGKNLDRSSPVARTRKSCVRSRKYRTKCERDEEMQKYVFVFDDGGKRFGCKVCGHRYNSPDNLLLHTRFHTGIGLHTCDVCKKSFPTKTALDIHQLSHTNDTPFECAKCHRGFKSKYRLTSHMRVHSDEKPYKCNCCEKCFRCQMSLRDHIRTHDKQLQYKCDTCGKHYAVERNLKAHMRKHTGELPYSCPHCTREYWNKTLLQRHMLSHGEKAHKCDLCGMRFARPDTLKVHIKTHTGERNYKCHPHPPSTCILLTSRSTIIVSMNKNRI